MTTRPLTDLPLDARRLVLEVAEGLAPRFQGVLGPETIQRYVVDSMHQLLATARPTASLSLLTERFARERLQALAKLQGSLPSVVPAVLFLCVHNAGRSQMAAGWTRRLAGERVVVYSGGSEPAAEINAAVVAAMDEVGIDVREEFPKPWTDEVVRVVDVVITMGCGDACPVYTGKRYEDWELDDPRGRGVESVRPIRDEIRRRVEALLVSLAVSPN